jgi:hypothetical protein
VPRRRMVGKASARAQPTGVSAKKAGYGGFVTIVCAEPATLSVTLRLGDPRILQEAALRWTYVLRSRKRWAGAAGVDDDRAANAVDQLTEFGVTEAQIATMGKSSQIEVRVDGQRSESDTWAARIFPWEFVIAGATRPWRQGRPTTISRVLDMGRPAGTLPPSPIVQPIVAAN